VTPSRPGWRRGTRDLPAGGAGDEVAKGSAISVEVDGIDIAVVHADDDQFYAGARRVQPRRDPLSEGEIDGCTLECWLHGSRFDLRTGEPDRPARHRAGGDLPRRDPRRRHLRFYDTEQWSQP
jgi:nitrite reductase/ring-hydroxylating ferredoxin subunit